MRANDRPARDSTNRLYLWQQARVAKITDNAKVKQHRPEATTGQDQSNALVTQFSLQL
jgi:hypothetical protein